MRTFLTAQWQYLLMLNYQVDPVLLRRHLPAGVELDSWNSVHYVSLVGFRFLETRVMGVPIPFHRSFDEVNLRFYVRRQSAQGWRRGVVFIKEIVPRRLIAAVARRCYNEPYIALPMRHRIESSQLENGVGGIVEYGWFNQGSWNWLRATTVDRAETWSEGSEEQFISEHYWGYTGQRDGGCKEYQVEHIPWKVWRTSGAEVIGDMRSLYGEEFAEIIGAGPQSAFVADGSAVAVGWGKRF